MNVTGSMIPDSEISCSQLGHRRRAQKSCHKTFRSVQVPELCNTKYRMDPHPRQYIPNTEFENTRCGADKHEFYSSCYC